MTVAGGTVIATNAGAVSIVLASIRPQKERVDVVDGQFVGTEHSFSEFVRGRDIPVPGTSRHSRE